MRDGTLQIDHQIRGLDKTHHDVEKGHVRLEVPLRKIAHGVIVGDEDVHSLEYRPVLDDDIVAFGNFEDVLEPLLQEIHFQVEGPPLDVLVIVLLIGIICYGFEFRGPPVMLRQHSRESRFSAPDITGYSYVHMILDAFWTASTQKYHSGKKNEN